MIGGSTVLTKTDLGFEIEMPGKHKQVVKDSGEVVRDVSVSTLSNIEIEGTLKRENRLIKTGELKIDHNLAEFTTYFRPENLQFDSSCRCPVSGKVEIERVGSKTGKLNIEFNSCGSVTITDQDGEAKEKTIHRCLPRAERHNR